MTPDLLRLVKLTYPDGFEDNLITFSSPKGELELALPLETDEVSYLIKMPKDVAIEEDDNDSSDTPSRDMDNIEGIDIADDDSSSDDDDDDDNYDTADDGDDDDADDDY